MEDWLKTFWNLQLYSGENGASITVGQLFIAFLIVVFGVIVSRWATSVFSRQVLQKRGLERNTAFFLQKLLNYLLLVVVVLIALPMAGIPITIFTVLGGALAIGVGFGAQNLFNNLISGIIIMVEKPIRLGDIVELQDEQGRIEDIGNRRVRIRRTDGVDVLMPNSHFLENAVVNWTLFDNNVRGIVHVGIAYGSDTRKASDLMMEAMVNHERVLKEPDPIILFDDFADSALTFTLLFWAHLTRPMDMRTIKSDLRYKIDDLFRENGIVIAFPQRDLHMDAMGPIEVKLTREAKPAS
ncbi:MAG: mechanosensitive ion channel family protein [Opitutales bacterium]